MKLITQPALFITAIAIASSCWAVTTAHEADNSGKNKRDDSVTEVTADNQSNNKEDLETTRKIRAELMSKKNLSTYAHNIKIIVSGKQVVLKGPVRSKSEIKTITKVAHTMAPDLKIKNELEVATK